MIGPLHTDTQRLYQVSAVATRSVAYVPARSGLRQSRALGQLAPAPPSAGWRNEVKGESQLLVSE